MVLFGHQNIFKAYNTVRLLIPVGIQTKQMSNSGKNYDLVVIGGGSGGLACAKEAASFGKQVAVLDFVTPSAQGTKWGLGGTCVNVGCIPKKLMHHVAHMRPILENANLVGWQGGTGSAQLNWSTMAEKVQNYVKSLNWGHRVALRENKVTYINGKGRFKDKGTVVAIDMDGREISEIKSKYFVIAVGGRPKYPDIPGAREFGITSDDIFWINKKPGKTLVVGGSYVALECAGFLQAFNCDTTLMIRSIPLRGFDQQMAASVVECMEKEHGIKILRNCEPSSVEKISKSQKLKVTWKKDGKEICSDTYDTVLFAVGRYPCTADLNLSSAGVSINTETKKIIGGGGNDATQKKGADLERTTADNIYAIGDVLQGGVELTPVAIKAGKLLAHRLFNGESDYLDYKMIATTVFTPLEYACIGLSEEDAVKQHGKTNVEVYHSYYRALEETIIDIGGAGRCYIKMLCDTKHDNKVLGLHILGPNAGEIMQGFAVAIKMGVTLKQMKATIGIHPTSAEEVVKLHITKSSGKDPHMTGC